MKKLLFLVLLLPFLGTAQINLSSGLVAYYPFNGNANDSSGNKLHGTTSNVKSATDRFGKNNSAYSFTGSVNSFISIPHNNLLNFQDKFSFSLWYYKDSPQVNNNYSGLFFKGRDVDNGYGFAIISEKEYFYVRQNTDYIPGAGVTKPEASQMWHHAVGILDDKNSILRLYIDGSIVSQVALSEFVASNDYPLVLGRHFRNKDGSGSYEYAFNGKLDEVRFYNRVLTDDEIDALFTQNTVGLTEVNATGIKIFPNPANEKLYINLGENQINAVVQITDLAGKAVATRRINNNDMLEIESIKPGVYLISVTTAKNNYTSKVIIN